MKKYGVASVMVFTAFSQVVNAQPAPAKWDRIQYVVQGQTSWIPTGYLTLRFGKGPYVWNLQYDSSGKPVYPFSVSGTGIYTFSHAKDAARTVTLFANLDGTVSAKFQWNPNGINPPVVPPNRLITRVWSSANGTIAPQGGVSLNNGFDVPMGVESAGNNRFHYFKNKLKTYVLPVSTSTPVQVDTPQLTISTQVSMVSTYGEVHTSYVYDATVLPYPYITTDYDVTYRREGIYRLPNLRKGDMDLTIDTMAVWSDRYGCWLGATPVIVDQSVYGTPEYSWLYTGDGSLSSPIPAVSEFSLEVRDLATEHKATQNLAKESKLQVSISDENDASEPPVLTEYKIRWHFPYENWRRKPGTQPFYVWQQQSISNVDEPGTCGYNESIGFTFTYGNPFWATVVDPASKAFQIIGPIAGTEFPVVGALMEVLGVTLTDFGPKSLQSSASFNACWSDTHSVFPDGKSEPMHRYDMAPIKLAEYRIEQWVVDAYGSQGYIGETLKDTDVFSGHKSAGTFTLAAPPAVGGTE